jgi:rhodanese-related sulfurtransferase
MMMKHLLKLVAVLLIGLAGPVMAAEVPTMDQQELKDRIGSADLVVIDVRTSRDWDASDRKIAGAVREDPNQAFSWAKSYDKAKTIVLYCA